jgi:predicted TIM-barrel fold metal-dependent hydrolase
LKYRKGKFDLFHIGYPYTNELITMIKMYPNSYINLCWIPEISVNLYKNTLNLLIDIIPSNKIFGFGGDYLFVEGTYGAQKIARKALLEVLYKRVESKYFSFEEAVEFAEKVLNKNPKSIYLK